MAGSFHGGQFWQAIGDEFGDLDRRRAVVNADVLDAWFPPPPEVVDALCHEAAWLARTSPPTNAEGLERAISQAQGIPAESVLAGPGSSALLYHLGCHWIPPQTRALVLEPMYGEYAHLASLFGWDSQFFLLSPEEDFAFDEQAFLRRVEETKPSLITLVNPNNPSGTQFDVPRLVAQLPAETRVLVDEAYINYTSAESAEHLASTTKSLIVVKTLSKGFALSGLRAAYLVAHPEVVADLRRFVPPWWVSLPAQIGAVSALQASDYYRERWHETEYLRIQFLVKVSSFPICVRGAAANWVLVQLPDGVSCAELVSHCQCRGVFLRDAGLTAPSLGDSFVRIAIKPLEEQDRIVECLTGFLLAPAREHR